MHPAGKERKHVGDVGRALDVRVGTVDGRVRLAGVHRDSESVVALLHHAVAVARVVRFPARRAGTVSFNFSRKSKKPLTEPSAAPSRG